LFQEYLVVVALVVLTAAHLVICKGVTVAATAQTIQQLAQAAQQTLEQVAVAAAFHQTVQVAQVAVE
jgi:hypothetical protein